MLVPASDSTAGISVLLLLSSMNPPEADESHLQWLRRTVVGFPNFLAVILTSSSRNNEYLSQWNLLQGVIFKHLTGKTRCYQKQCQDTIFLSFYTNSYFLTSSPSAGTFSTAAEIVAGFFISSRTIPMIFCRCIDSTGHSKIKSPFFTSPWVRG